MPKSSFLMVQQYTRTLCAGSSTSKSSNTDMPNNIMRACIHERCDTRQQAKGLANLTSRLVASKSTFGDKGVPFRPLCLESSDSSKLTSASRLFDLATHKTGEIMGKGDKHCCNLCHACMRQAAEHKCLDPHVWQRQAQISANQVPVWSISASLMTDLTSVVGGKPCW